MIARSPILSWPGNNPGQVVYIHVSLSPSSVIFISLTTGKVKAVYRTSGSFPPMYRSCVCTHCWLIALETEMSIACIGHRALRERCWLSATIYLTMNVADAWYWLCRVQELETGKCHLELHRSRTEPELEVREDMVNQRNCTTRRISSNREHLVSDTCR